MIEAMHRRAFLRGAATASAAVALGSLPGTSRLRAQTAHAGRRRIFEITTRIDIKQPSGPTRIWVPTPQAVAPYQETLGDTYHLGEGGRSVMVENEDVDMLVAEWPAGAAPLLTLTSRVATSGHAANLAEPTVPPPLTLDGFARFLRPTRFIPVDGLVKSTATEITRGAGTDIEKARAIYEWIVDHTFRDPKTIGCGTGDIRFMLESKSLSGKCADLNSLFVGLARAAGLPARDVWGLRVAKSEHGLRSLGLSSDNASKAQHCRAEVYLVGYGWVPVDPADVRKLVLEEPPGNLPLTDETVRATRARLFGSWEMNWIAYNVAHDVALPGSKHGGPVPYLMYPQAETANGRLDSLDPEAFSYEITVREPLQNV
jgi:transglutaminase-like putative cysteine protease